MHNEQLILQAPDGYQIAAAIYLPEQTPRGYLHICHGMSEYHQRYDHFARFIAEQGYAVGLHSHRGHGDNAHLNGTPLGYYGPEEGFHKVVTDVDFVIQHLRQTYQLPKPTLLGHSMGSIVVRRYIELYSEHVQSVIIMGTLAHSAIHQIGAVVAKTMAKRYGGDAVASFIDRLSFSGNNRKIKSPRTPKDWLSRDAAQVDRYLDDPYCNYTSTYQFYADFMEGFELASRPSEIAKIRKDLSILCISGSADPIGSYGKGVWKVARTYYTAGISNVTVHLFDDMRHEILNETNNDVIYHTILQWLEKKNEN
ncbi:alpha/beta hydrolase [Kurthia massiliensis]|uniref:alpha/beta hydrolase n=1 Tax=Kurthia massiliensis TaxID=1033739 RepID=UPI000287C4D6|nr:alpha/beta hydrolase [Kurthia massiliensis]